MHDKESAKTGTPIGFALALAIGVFTVGGVRIAHSLLTGSRLDLSSELGIYILNVVMVALPFVVLALDDIRTRPPWLAGIALTAALWGYVLYYGVAHYGDGTGANIGLGIMLLLSPIFISAAVFMIGRRSGPGNSAAGKSGDNRPV